ncbi:hypothetical protein, partial [Enterococcus faecium]|uniref:hypothetical protein n=1 Tax=Enterococcus faecium TaxID=1352 RepID=UPI0035DF03A1
RHAHDAYVCCHEFKKTSHMAMESKKAYGFLFQISTKTNKKELVIKPLLFVYSLKKAKPSCLLSLRTGDPPGRRRERSKK